MSTVTVASKEDMLSQKLNEALRANADLQMELSALRETNLHTTNNRLASKIRSQAYALNTLNRRVRTQRLVLRKLNELGRDLTVDEWNDLKAANPEHFEDTTTLYI